MSVLVELVTVGQRIDLSTQEVQHLVYLKLPNGKVVEVETDGDTTQEIVAIAFTGNSFSPVAKLGDTVTVAPSEQAATPQPMVRLDDGQVATVFGEDPEEAPHPDPMPAPQPVRRVGTVASDENGYPIVRTAGAVDMSTVTDPGSGNVDDDGVSSV